MLGVAPGASVQEVTAAFRRLARLHHPDLHADCDEEERHFHHERMASLTAAYQLLTDPREQERFRLYQRRRAPRQQGASRGGEDARSTARTTDSPAGTPTGDAGTAAGDPQFDYRARAAAEFDVGNAPRDGRGRTGRRRRGVRRRRHR